MESCGTSVLVSTCLVVLAIGYPDSAAGLPSDPSDCLAEKASHCREMASRIPSEQEPELLDLFNVAFWENFCNQTDHVYKCVSAVCPASHVAMTAAMSESNFWPLIPSESELNVMRLTGCMGSSVRHNISHMYDVGDNLECLDSYASDVTECVQPFLDESGDVRRNGEWQTLHPDRQRSLIRFAGAMFQCAMNVAMTLCGKNARDLLKYVVKLTVPLDMRPNVILDHIHTLNDTDTLSTLRATVGVFGDPHLIMYDINRTALVTCTTPGSRVLYLSNAVLSISGDNRVIDDDTGATVLSSVEVEFYNSGPRIGLYRARDEELPAHFINRRPTITGNNPIQISEEGPDRVLINCSTKAFSLMIQRWDDGYSFSVRLGRGVLQASSGLLVTGCSHRHNHVIDVRSYIGNTTNKRALDDCKAACQKVQSLEMPELNNTCIFDCLVTGQTKYADIGQSFLEDLHSLAEIDASLPLIAPPPPTAPQVATGSATAVRSSQLSAVLSVLVWISVTLLAT